MPDVRYRGEAGMPVRVDADGVVLEHGGPFVAISDLGLINLRASTYSACIEVKGGDRAVAASEEAFHEVAVVADDSVIPESPVKPVEARQEPEAARA